MTFLVHQLTEAEKSAVRVSLRASLATLSMTKETVDQMVQDNFEAQAELPHNTRISDKERNEQLAQVAEELAKSIKNQEILSRKIARLSELERNLPASSFQISSTTTRTELKILMQVIDVKLKGTRDPAERLFLETVLENADTCKRMLDEKKTFEGRVIPLLPTEARYVEQLIQAQAQAQARENMIAQCGETAPLLRTIEAQVQTLEHASPASEGERAISNELLTTFKRAFETHLVGNSKNPDAYLREVSTAIDKASTASARVPVSSGFKGVINSLCQALGKAPFFREDKSQDFKNKFQALMGDIRKKDPDVDYDMADKPPTNSLSRS